MWRMGAAGARWSSPAPARWQCGCSSVGVARSCAWCGLSSGACLACVHHTCQARHGSSMQACDSSALYRRDRRRPPRPAAPPLNLRSWTGLAARRTRAARQLEAASCRRCWCSTFRQRQARQPPPSASPPPPAARMLRRLARQRFWQAHGQQRAQGERQQVQSRSETRCCT